MDYINQVSDREKRKLNKKFNRHKKKMDAEAAATKAVDELLIIRHNASRVRRAATPSGYAQGRRTRFARFAGSKTRVANR